MLTLNPNAMKKIVKILTAILLLFIFVSSGHHAEAGPFGKYGKWVECSGQKWQCIYHFFISECFVGTIIIAEE